MSSLNFTSSRPPSSLLPKPQTLVHRIAECPSQYLSDAELLALVIKHGEEDNLNQAQRIIAQCKGIDQLAEMSFTELLALPGVNQAQAASIQGAIAFSGRLTQSRAARASMNSPASVAEYMRPLLSNLQHEEFHVLLLDSKNHLVRDCKISKGILDRAVVHAREIFRAAIQGCSKTIILVHNHPTGDCEPSPHDIEASKSLVKAGKLIGIEVLDHVIIGKPSENNASYFFSMREKGILSSTD